MSDPERKRLSLLRLCAALLALIVVLLLIGGLLLFRNYTAVSERLRSADAVIDSLQSVTAKLDTVDWQSLSDTAAGVTAALDEAQLDELVAELHTVSASLAAIDWEALAADAAKSMELAQQSLTEAMDALDEMDIETLNSAIRDLQTVIEPLARLMGRG